MAQYIVYSNARTLIGHRPTTDAEIFHHLKIWNKNSLYLNHRPLRASVIAPLQKWPRVE